MYTQIFPSPSRIFCTDIFALQNYFGPLPQNMGFGTIAMTLGLLTIHFLRFVTHVLAHHMSVHLPNQALLENCASFGLTLPCHLEQVLRVGKIIVPVKVEQSGGADGARPSPADAGLAG